MDGLVVCAKCTCGVRNDSGIGRISDIAPDITCQTKHTATSVGLNLIQIGIEFNCALGGWQCDQQSFCIHEDETESSYAGFTINAMRIACQLKFEKIAFAIGKNPLIDEGWALPIRGELPFALKPAFCKPNGEIIIGFKYQQP